MKYTTDIEFPTRLRRSMDNLPDLVIYHGTECRDGWCAAWVSRHFAPKAKGHAINYDPVRQLALPDLCEGKRVLIVDFCPDAEILDQCHEKAEALVVLDHHASRFAIAQERDYVLLDVGRSGAMLAWDYFTGGVLDDPLNPVPTTCLRCTDCKAVFRELDAEDVDIACLHRDEPSIQCDGELKLWFSSKVQVDSYETPPWVVAYVEDRDLWKWDLAQSRNINAVLQATELSAPAWDELLKSGREQAIMRGQAVFTNQQQLVKGTLKGAQYRDFCDYPNVAFCATTPGLASEVGHALCLDETVPFAVLFWTRSESEGGGIKISIRNKQAGNPLRCNVCLQSPTQEQYLERDDVPMPDSRCLYTIPGDEEPITCIGRLLQWPPSAADIAKQWGGGGHPGAAGAIVKDIQLVDWLIADLEGRAEDEAEEDEEAA